MKVKSKEKNCISFCLPLRLYEEEFEKNLLFLYNVQHVIVFGAYLLVIITLLENQVEILTVT